VRATEDALVDLESVVESMERRQRSLEAARAEISMLQPSEYVR